MRLQILILASLTIMVSSDAIARENSQVRAVKHNNAALKLHTKGDVHGAMNEFTKAIACDPKAIVPYTNRAELRKKLKDYQGARDDFEKALQISDDNITALEGRASLNEECGDFPSAIKDYSRLIRIHPQLSYRYLHSRGLVKRKMGHESGALSDFEREKQISSSAK
jgi:tetratricopeptide (TPR) repeat protein